MIVELSHTEAEQLSKYRVQPLFTSSQNSQISCPYCNKKVGLILKENLIIGGTNQLEYRDIYSQKELKDQTHMQLLKKSLTKKQSRNQKGMDSEIQNSSHKQT